MMDSRSYQMNMDKDILTFIDRQAWRSWLATHSFNESEAWLVIQKKHSTLPGLFLVDAVEEALCFGWIDSTVKSLNEKITIQRFCKRRKNSTFSQPNIERLKWLFENNLIHNSIKKEILEIIRQDFDFPKDIISQLMSEKDVWKNYQSFSEPYKRISIAYIDSARHRPEEFDKRLKNFIDFIQKCPRVGTDWLKEFDSFCKHGSRKEHCDKCLQDCLDRLNKQE